MISSKNVMMVIHFLEMVVVIVVWMMVGLVRKKHHQYVNRSLVLVMLKYLRLQRPEGCVVHDCHLSRHK